MTSKPRQHYFRVTAYRRSTILPPWLLLRFSLWNCLPRSREPRSRRQMVSPGISFSLNAQVELGFTRASSGSVPFCVASPTTSNALAGHRPSRLAEDPPDLDVGRF